MISLVVFFLVDIFHTKRKVEIMFSFILVDFRVCKKKSQNNSDLIKCEKNDDKILRCALRLKNECKNYFKILNYLRLAIKTVYFI